LNGAGAVETSGFSSGTPGNLIVNGNLFFASTSTTRMLGGSSSDRITVSGDIALAGSLQVSLSPGTVFGRFPLILYGGERTGTAALTGIPGGVTAHLSTSIAGSLDLVINDSDEDSLPDTWEINNFGNLSQTADGDKDGDGSSNLVEYRLNLNPSNGTSAFKATRVGNLISWPSAPGIVFTVRRSLLLEDGNWPAIANVVGGAGSVSSYADPESFDKAFYRVEFTP
jgi:hypothetical protein